MMNNRSFQQHLGQGHFSEFERRSSSSQNSNVDREVLDLIQRIRSCKPYLLKRLKSIEEAGQTKLLRDEVKDIGYWLEIAKEVRADIIYGRDTLEVVLEKMMDMIRIHPISGAFNNNPLNESDEDESAPRSPSPPSGNDFDLGPRVIPMERNQEQSNDWGVQRRDYLSQNSQSSSRSNEDWGSGSTNEFVRRGDGSRGDTDMRLDLGFDGRPMGRGRGLANPFRDDSRHVGGLNPDSMRRNPNSWGSGGGVGGPYNSRDDNSDISSRERNIERSHERSRGGGGYDFDYRRRSRSRSPPPRNIYSSGHSPSRDRSNERRESYYRDEDLRDMTRHGDQRNVETGGRGFDFDRPPPRDPPPIIRDRRHEFNDQENPWSNAMQQQQQQQQQQHVVGLNPTFGGGGQNVNDIAAALQNFNQPFNPAIMFSPAFMALSPIQQQSLTGLLAASQLPNMNMSNQNLSGLLPTPLNSLNIGTPQQQQPIIQNIQSPHQQQQLLGNNSPLPLGPQSPININSINSSYPSSHSVSSSSSSHPSGPPSSLIRPPSGLLPTPHSVRSNLPNQNNNNNNNNFNPSQSHNPFTSSQGQQQRPPTIPNMPHRFEVRPRNSTPDPNQFRQRAQQHFARPRPPPVPRPPNVGSNTIINPNLATNQIVSDLPLDPRRRSILERQNQQQQQSHTSDSRQQQQRRPISSPPPPHDSTSTNRSQTTSGGDAGHSNNNVNKRREVSQKDLSQLKRIADRVKDAIPSKEKPKGSKLQELRKNFEKHGYHRLGTKGKNTFEEVQSESERAKSPDKEKEQQTSSSTRTDKSSGDDRSKQRHVSPPSARSSSSRNRETRSSKDKSPKRNDRRTKQSHDEEKSTGKNKRKDKSPAKSKEKNNSPISATVKNVTQKSVASFRIPKLKKPDPPPEPEPTRESDTVESSPDRELSEEHDAELSDTESHPENVETSITFTSPPHPTVPATPPPAENETDALLRMFMAKSVGLEENVLEHLFDNPSAMEKIKSLLKDQVSKIVQDESPTAPTSVPLDKIKTEFETEDFEEPGKRAASPNHVQDEESTSSRSRSLPKKRASKRRSSLERLHDALREMNFDAILPLGPRRAAHTRGQVATASEGEPSTTVEARNVTVPVDVEGDDDELTIDDIVTNELTLDEDVPSSSMNETVEKALPKGRKRRTKGTAVGGRKRGKKVAGTASVAVTAAAALAAVSAIPEFEVGSKNVRETSQSDSEQIPDAEPTTMGTTTPKKGVKRGRKGGPKEPIPELDNTTAEQPRETRSAANKKGTPKKASRPSEPTETRVLRPRVSQKLQQPDIRLNPHLNKVKLEQDYNQGVAFKLERVERERNHEDSRSSEKDLTSPSEKENPASPPPPSLSLAVTLSPPSSPVATTTTTTDSNSATEAVAGPMDLEEDVPADIDREEPVREHLVFDRSVFLGLSPDPQSDDVSDQVLSHDKLLSDATAPLVVKRVFSATFGQYMEFCNQNQCEQEKQSDMNDVDKISKIPSVAISPDVKDVVEWMLNTIQFRHDQEAIALCTENEDDELVDGLIINSTRSSDDDDEGDEDEEEEEEEELEEDKCKDDEKTAMDAGDEIEEESNINDNPEPSPDKLQIKVEPETDIEFLPNGVEDMDESLIKVEPFDFDLPNKDEKEELNEESSNEEGNGEGGRTTNLEGHDLYRCANPNCEFTALIGAAFKEHAFICPFVSSSKQIQCFHCEKKLKSNISLMEHLKIHGKPRQVCSLCTFRCWVSSELTKHMKNAHRVYNCKITKETIGGEDPIQVMYPKEVASKMTQAHDLIQNHILYASKVQFRPSEIDSVPRTSIFTTLVHCGLCEYSTKVRSNIIRHLRLHTIAEKDGGDVPNKAPVNPVPCLERKELMFDKMTNWAGSSHTNKSGTSSKEDTLKLPKYVVDQFRYVCSVDSCKQITGQDDILCSHMKALHFKEKFYICPHCPEDEPTRYVEIHRIPHHLKLHGPRLSKCGHCDYIHYSSTSMEKHVAVKHVEKKPIFYLIRDLDEEGNPMNRRTSVDDASVKTNERWRCNLCKAVLNSWNDAMHHVQTAHKIQNQFECSLCHFGSDSIYAISTHSNTCRQGSQCKVNIMIMFNRNENFEVAEAKADDGINIPLWRRDAPRVKHIRGIFLEDETKPSSLSSTSHSSASKPTQSKTTPSSVNSTTPKTSCQVMLVCPKCKLYKTKNAVDMKVHLYNEMNYQRYKCTICELQFVTIDSLKVHISNDHKSSMDMEETRAELPIDPEIESNVYEIISEQLKNNEGNKSVEDKDGRNIENLLCKHCFLQFSSYHNYRTHILAKHIGTNRYKCNYCNLGFWHEVMLKQHHQKSTHADKPFVTVVNTEFEAMLSATFWLEEYGIPINKSLMAGRRKKPEKKMCQSTESHVNSKYLKCSHCDFTTESPASLKIHEAQPHSSDSGGKRSPAKRRSVSISDGDKDDLFVLSQSPKKVGTVGFGGKKSNNMSSLFRCEHCGCTFFTKRGVRRHWSRVHSLTELTCRYYEVKSQNDDNLAVHDGVVLLCKYCSYETSNATYMQDHHEKEHPSRPCRFKRKQRTVDVELGELSITVCSDCHCEFENFKKYSIHCQEKHPNSTMKHKTMKVNSSESMEPELADAKLLEDTVSVECPSCSQDCGSAKQYENHFKNYHNGREYLPPVFRYARSVIIEEVEIDLKGIVNKMPTSSRRSSESEDMPALKKHVSSNQIKMQQPTCLYACPKCDFKSPDVESLTNSHLVNHLLAYLCPVCNVGFRHSLDALFHLRHFHGECRLKPSGNPTAYVQFSSLKDQIIKVPNPKCSEVPIITLSDEDLDDEFDDALVLSLGDSSPLHRLQPEDLIEGFE